MRHLTYRHLLELALCSVWLLSACGGDGSSNPAPSKYSIGGTLSGLASGASVVLQDSGGDNTTVSANGDFNFSTQVANGTAYAVTIVTQATGQTCTVTSGSGTVSGANVTSVRVACAISTYTVSGTVSGLNSGAQVTVENNATDPTTVKANGSFTFATPIAYKGTYAITVATQPIAQSCTVTAGTGSGVSANISDVRVTCGPATDSVIHSFGATPAAGAGGAMIQGSDGNFYGTTAAEGTSGNGTVFKITSAGAETVLYSFAGGTTDGIDPTSLIQGSDGNFYGTTGAGGTSGNGTVFKITPAGVETVLYSFNGNGDGSYPTALIQGGDGNFYGATAAGGTSGCGSCGTVFKITPAGVETVLYSFVPADGNDPTSLIQGSDGNFYGTMAAGGRGAFCSQVGCGTVFKVTPAGVETVLYSFNGNSDGSYPTALIQGGDGNFYGTTSGGGAAAFCLLGCGTVFKITPAGVETVLHSFAGPTDGLGPVSLIQGSDGNFYGITSQGGLSALCSIFGCGTVFLITPAGAETVVYSFAGGTADGANPSAWIQGRDGNFYGRTAAGGTNGIGTVFKVTPARAETVLYSLAGGTTDGNAPSALTQGRDGNFYGTTGAGGTNNNGTVFKITPAGAETVLRVFAGGTTDGVSPTALIQGSDGNFYGTTSSGGTSNNGTVFKITPAGVETLLCSFAGGTTDGAAPTALIQGSDGNFYGITSGGGTNGIGTVFKVTPAGVETVLHSFAGGTADGASPTALIQGSDANFYGTTNTGGTSNYGTVFKVTPAGVETLLHSFAGGTTDGSYPTALIQGNDGNFYGIGSGGGTSNNGTVFKVTAAGIETVLYSFGFGPDGSNPWALIQGSDGNFYGITTGGGTNNGGTVFKITLAGVETVLYPFGVGPPTDGKDPTTLIQGSDGILYGTTYEGGLYGQGTMFKFQNH